MRSEIFTDIIGMSKVCWNVARIFTDIIGMSKVCWNVARISSFRSLLISPDWPAEEEEGTDVFSP